MYHHGHDLIMAWLPNPQDFFQVNKQEILSLIDYQCRTLSVPEEHVEDVTQEFLTRLLSGSYIYNPKYRSPTGKQAKITTYMFECARLFVLGTLRKLREEKEKMACIEEATPMYEESLKYQKEDNGLKEDFRIDLKKFLKALNRYPHKPPKKSTSQQDMFQDALKMPGMGYGVQEVAKKYHVSKVYISYVRRYAKNLYKEFLNAEVNRNSSLQPMWRSARHQYRIGRKPTPIPPVQPLPAAAPTISPASPAEYRKIPQALRLRVSQRIKEYRLRVKEYKHLLAA